MRDYTIIKVVQATHHQGDVRYGTSRGIQCSCLSLISLTWTLFKTPALWDKFDLDCILGKGDQLFKFIGKFRYHGIEDLPQEFLIENSLINLCSLRWLRLSLSLVISLIPLGLRISKTEFGEGRMKRMSKRKGSGKS